MGLPDGLENRIESIFTRMQERLAVFQSEFFEAGYKGEVPYLLPFLRDPDNLAPSVFDNLILDFYRGVEKRIREEKDPFERAFRFLTAYMGFIPVGAPSNMYHERHDREKSEFSRDFELMFFHPEILQDQAERFGKDSYANQARNILDQAGVYVLSQLESRDYGEPYRSKVGDQELIQNFKNFIDRVIEIGKLPWKEDPDDPVKLGNAVGDPIEMLKVVSQNADKFVRRYAAMYGHQMGSK